MIFLYNLSWKSGIRGLTILNDQSVEDKLFRKYQTRIVSTDQSPDDAVLGVYVGWQMVLEDK